MPDWAPLTYINLELMLLLVRAPFYHFYSGLRK